jgi:hypothetical protein
MILKILGWFFGILFLLIALADLFVSRIISAIMIVLLASLIIPPISNKITFEKKYKILIFLILLTLIPIINNMLYSEQNNLEKNNSELEIINNLGCDNCDDNNICTADSCLDNNCKHEKIKPCVGNNICESGELNSEDCKGIECLNDSNCELNQKCSSKQICCIDKCKFGNTFCSDTETMKCEIIKNGCRDYISKIIKNSCGVECKSNYDCGMGYLCDSNYKCKGYELNEKIKSGDFEWVFTKIEKKSKIGSTYFSEKADGVFIILYTTVENTGKSAQYLDSSFVKLFDEEDREFSSKGVYTDNAISFDKINPGIKKEGIIVFDVPTDIKIKEIRVSSNLIEDSFKSVKYMI